MSVGKFYLFSICVFIFTIGCAITTKDRGSESSLAAGSAAQPETSAELSLSEDRKQIEELRKDIPEPKKTDNELLRETLALLGEVSEPPQKHRDRFEKMIRKIRNDYQKQSRKTREAFTKNERQKREDFLNKLKEDRAEFLDDKPDKRRRDKFFNEQEVKRREFTAEERDLRQEFEGDAREKERDFSGLVREKTNEFYRELKLYEKRYQDWQKNEQLKRSGQNTNPTPTYKPIGTEDN